MITELLLAILAQTSMAILGNDMLANSASLKVSLMAVKNAGLMSVLSASSEVTLELSLMLLRALGCDSCLDEGLVLIFNVLAKSYTPCLLVSRVGGSD